MKPSLRVNVGMKSNEGNRVALTVGEVAERFGLAAHVLRHWEAMGLLSPERDLNDHRIYGPGDLYRVAVILRAKEAGLGLEAIREMLTTRDAAARRDILSRQREDLARRIAELEFSLALVECALECDHEDFTLCREFQAAMAARIGLDLPAHVRKMRNLPPDEPTVLIASGSRG
jgi:MerR family transcriptional regulator, copper efflux regulator